MWHINIDANSDGILRMLDELAEVHGMGQGAGMQGFIMAHQCKSGWRLRSGQDFEVTLDNRSDAMKMAAMVKIQWACISLGPDDFDADESSDSDDDKPSFELDEELDEMDDEPIDKQPFRGRDG